MDKKEFEEIRRKAEQGDAEAQCDLGYCYYQGDCVKKDPTEAVKWYRKAAEQGHVDGQFCLALSYRQGEGVAQDNAEAVKWFRKAAEQGDADSQCLLGNIYYQGDGVEKDIFEAVEWYRKAAEQGVQEAQCILGEIYIYGLGIEPDDAEAIKWYEKAASQGQEEAVEALKQIKAGTKLKVLNVVLRKEYALEIVQGKKVREYRAFSDFWVKRLCYLDDPEDKHLITGFKWYDRVHFYPYNNKWFVDCTIKEIHCVTVDEKFQEQYRDEVETQVGDMLFVIHLGKIIATNLEV